MGITLKLICSITQGSDARMTQAQSDCDQVLMSSDQKKLISLCAMLIAAYLALGFVSVGDLLPGSGIAMLWTGSGAP
jgi:hypothetical protein